MTSLTVILFMSVALTWMLGLSLQSSGTVQRAQNDADATLALQGAQRAAEYQIVTAMQYGFIPQGYVDLTAMSDSFTPGSTAYATVQTAGVGRHWVTGTCTVNGVTRSVRMHVKLPRGHGVWDNAIFVRDFVEAKALKIHGSVHLLGDILDGNYAMDVGGSAYVRNNYYGMPLGLEGMVPPLEIVNGKETLNAEFRVRNGQVRFKGLSSAGEETDPDGGASKGFLDGTFTAQSITGDVYSNNGVTETYDLTATPVAFPLLSDAYVDEFGVPWPSHTAFLDARSLTIPENRIEPGTNFEYGPDVWGNWIKVTDLGGERVLLEINGIIKVDVMRIRDAVVEYRGTGTFYATDEIELESDIVPAPGEIFPTTSSLGFIAVQEFEIEGKDDSNPVHRVVGAFYSAVEMEIEDGMHIAGSLVAREIDFDDKDNDGDPLDDNGDGGVPTIYQVPSLGDNLPPGMPGANRVGDLTVTILNWRVRTHAEIGG